MSKVTELLEQLKSVDEADRRYAIEDLGDLGDPSCLPGLVEALEDSSVAVRETASDVLVKFDARQVAEAVIGAVDNENVALRNAALDVLAQLGPLTYGDVHKRLLMHESTDLKKFAIDIFIRVGVLDPSERSEILRELESLLSHPNENVAGAALEALALHKGLVDPKKFLQFVGQSPWLEMNALMALHSVLGPDLLSLKELDAGKLNSSSKKFLNKLKEKAA